MKRRTYDVIRKAIERDLVRDLGNREVPRGLRAVRSRTLPTQDDLAVIDGDQPAGFTQRQPHFLNASHLGESESACPRDVAEEGLPREMARTYFDFLRPSSTSPSTSVTRSTETTAPSDPSTLMVTSSRSNHSLAHGVTVLFFQCQFAVLYAMGVTDILFGLYRSE